MDIIKEAFKEDKDEKVSPKKSINPSRIMEIGLGFWPSKVLLTAVNLKLFTILAYRPMSGSEIRQKLNLSDRGIYDFLDSLVALGFLKRSGIRNLAFYSNSDDANMFLDANKPDYIGGMLEMSNNRLYPFWGNLEEALKTGKPQSEIKHGGTTLFHQLIGNKSKLKEFVNAMEGKKADYLTFAEEFDFSNYNSLCDIGGASGHLAAQVALHNPHMTCISFDLEQVNEIAEESIKALNIDDRVIVKSGDFFKDEFPKVDVITMSNILHNWGLEDKKLLLKKAYASLPDNGTLAVMECLIDNNRDNNAEALMMSLNMLVETESGFDFSFDDFKLWAEEIGFKDFSLFPLSNHTTAIIAIK